MTITPPFSGCDLELKRFFIGLFAQISKYIPMAEKLLPLKKAAKKLKDKNLLSDLLSKASQKAQQNRERLEGVWADFQTLLEMLKAYMQRKYTVIPWGTLLKIVAALIYFVNPLDLIPDFVPAMGFVDDIGVIAYVMGSLKTDIDNFSAWQNQNQNQEVSGKDQILETTPR